MVFSAMFFANNITETTGGSSGDTEVVLELFQVEPNSNSSSNQQNATYLSEIEVVLQDDSHVATTDIEIEMKNGGIYKHGDESDGEEKLNDDIYHEDVSNNTQKMVWEWSGVQSSPYEDIHLCDIKVSSSDVDSLSDIKHIKLHGVFTLRTPVFEIKSNGTVITNESQHISGSFQDIPDIDELILDSSLFP